MPEDREMNRVGQLARTAGAMLLVEPDQRLSLALRDSGYREERTPEALRQEFYDRLCIAQSGRYLPAYEHVFRRCEQDGDLRHFPPARCDGGREVEAVYGQFGFHHTGLEVTPLLRGPHLPGDHLGFMLVFCGWVLGDGELQARARDALAGFVDAHLGEWVEEFCLLLPTAGSEYLQAVADAVLEATGELRDFLTDTEARVSHTRSS